MMQDRPTIEGSPERTGRAPCADHRTIPRHGPAQQAHRRWVFRSTVLLALTAAGICFFVAWRRDDLTISARLDLLARPVAELQEQVNKLGRLPAEPPTLDRESLNYYASDADRYFAAHTQEPLIIGTTTSSQMLFKSDGRAVIIFERGKVRAQWMTDSAYQAAWDDQEQRIAEFEKKRLAQPIVLP